jgi:hypothetical protein
MNWIRRILLKFLAVEINRTKTLGKGDIIFVKMADWMSVHERAHQVDILQRVFPDNIVTHLYPGVDIEIVRCGAGNEETAKE